MKHVWDGYNAQIVGSSYYIYLKAMDTCYCCCIIIIIIIVIVIIIIIIIISITNNIIAQKCWLVNQSFTQSVQMLRSLSHFMRLTLSGR